MTEGERKPGATPFSDREQRRDVSSVVTGSTHLFHSGNRHPSMIYFQSTDGYSFVLADEIAAAMKAAYELEPVAPPFVCTGAKRLRRYGRQTAGGSTV